MTLHIRNRWKEAFLTMPDGRVIFLKQNGKDVAELITSQEDAARPTGSHPMRAIFNNTTVRKRVEEILREHGKRLKIIPIGTTPQQVSFPEGTQWSYQ